MWIQKANVRDHCGDENVLFLDSIDTPALQFCKMLPLGATRGPWGPLGDTG